MFLQSCPKAEYILQDPAGEQNKKLRVIYVCGYLAMTLSSINYNDIECHPNNLTILMQVRDGWRKRLMIVQLS